MAEPQTLPAMVRAKYPGVYDDLSDAQLDAKVRTKYPGMYDDLPRPPAEVSHPEAKISAAVPGTAKAPDDPNIIAGAIGPKARQVLDAPLAHTGVDAIDTLSSPANLVSTGAMGLAGVEGLVNLAKSGGIRAMLKGAAEMTVVPVVKYKITKAALMALHLPSDFAEPIATMVAGYKKGAAPTEAAPSVAVTEPPETASARIAPPPAAVASPPAPVPPPATVAEAAAVQTPAPATLEAPAGPSGKFPTQKALNELALSARRAKVTLTPESERAGLDLMRQGAPAEQVVARLQQVQTLKDKIPAADVAAFLKLRQAGKSPADAEAAIAAMRTLRSRFSLPTADDVKTSFQQLYERGQKTAPHE